MSAIVCAYQRETEEVEDNEAEIWRPELQDINRQISRRQMAAVQRIQQNIEDCVPSIRAACKMANDHHKQLITRKRKTTIMQEKRKYKGKSMCLGTSPNLQAFEEQLLWYIFELQEQGMAVSSNIWLSRSYNCQGNFKRGCQMFSTVMWDDKLSGMDLFIGWACQFSSGIQGNSESTATAFI